VLVPELKGMKSFRILFSDVDDIVASFNYLSSLKDRVDEEKMGLMGFSYGAGPTFMAAASPSIHGQVKFLVSFGGYYDPVNVIRFITTGGYEYGNEKGFLKPDPYGKWVFFMNNVDYVENKRDQKLLTVVFRE
jgi:dienelactone hydrolase